MHAKLFFNGDIITMEENLYTEALLIENGKIVKTGSKDDLLKIAAEDTQLVDLNGKTLLPSFIDAHSHFSGYATSFQQVSLEEVIDFDEIQSAVKNFIKNNQVEPGKWVIAKGYENTNLTEKKHPSKDFLDKIAPNNPLVLQHTSGHMGLFNSKALEILGITIDTPNPEGGMIGRENGKLTGYMEETAYVSNIQKIPVGSTEDFMNCLFKAQDKYASYGITTIQEGMIVKPLADLLVYLKTINGLKLDLIGYVDIKHADEILPKFQGAVKEYSNHLKIGGYKTFLDGSPQGRTAWLSKPYENAEDGYCGYPVCTDADLEANLEKALNDDIQILAHCNGDAACQQYITQYAHAKAKTQNDHDIRPVIIHSQLLREDQLDEVKALHMIPSFFVAHVYYWGDLHIKNFGLERASNISLAESARKKDIIFTFHQDTPVIEPNMLETLWIAVNRITKDGVLLGKDQRLEPLEALKAITINAAYQYFEEDLKGSLKENKLADLVILDQNPLKVDPMTIKDIKVLETIKEGQTIFKR